MRSLNFFGVALRWLSEPLAYRGRPHGLERHEQRLDAHDHDGNSLATLASVYPALVMVAMVQVKGTLRNFKHYDRFHMRECPHCIARSRFSGQDFNPSLT